MHVEETVKVNMPGTCSMGCVCNSATCVRPPKPRVASRRSGPMIGNERSRSPRVVCRELEILPDGAVAT